jgi:hypothetical protein
MPEKQLGGGSIGPLDWRHISVVEAAAASDQSG